MPDYKELVEDFFDFYCCHPPSSFVFSAFEGTFVARRARDSDQEYAVIGYDICGSSHIMLIKEILALQKYIGRSLLSFRRKKLYVDLHGDKL
jgi:hypothetical protein